MAFSFSAVNVAFRLELLNIANLNGLRNFVEIIQNEFCSKGEIIRYPS